MPNRIIKESVCTSDTIDQMTWFEECFYTRLWTACDDYGRMDARPAILKSKLFPLKERLSLKDIQNALQKMVDIGCVRLYECDSKPYLYLPSWEVHQQVRAKKSKYPSPDESCYHMMSDDIKCHRNPIQSESESESEKRARAARSAPQDPEDYGFGSELASAFADWLKYKREKRQEYKPTGLSALVSQVRNNAAKYGEPAVAALIRQCMAANWQGIIWDKLEKSVEQPVGGKPGKYTAQDFQPTPERIRKNAERLDAFLAEQEGRRGGSQS